MYCSIRVLNKNNSLQGEVKTEVFLSTRCSQCENAD